MKQVLRNKNKGTALERYKKSFINSIEGLIYGFRYEHNVIIMILALIVTTIWGFMYDIASYEWLFQVGIIGAVFASEYINSSIEATIDLITLEDNKLAKIAKDTASTASLILSITAFIGALIIYLPKI